MLVYVSGKYSGDIDANILAAQKVAVDLWEMGHHVICPHLNTIHFENTCRSSYEHYIAGDLDMISRLDCLVMIPGWEESKGALIEKEYAEKLDMPIYYAPDYPALHPTEIKCPEQAQAFRETVGKMYRIHLSKNADYSPANILATGELGVVTRLWDKTARLMNLTGIQFEHLLHTGVFPPKEPKHEAIDDTYLDLAVYAIIGLLLRKNKWGR